VGRSPAGFAESCDAPGAGVARAEIVVAVKIGSETAKRPAATNRELVLNIVVLSPICSMAWRKPALCEDTAKQWQICGFQISGMRSETLSLSYL
jgi:hypothetical protein